MVVLRHHSPHHRTLVGFGLLVGVADGAQPTVEVPFVELVGLGRADWVCVAGRRVAALAYFEVIFNGCAAGWVPPEWVGLDCY